MTCNELLRLLAENEGLPAEALEHLRTCKTCRRLHDMRDQFANDAAMDSAATIDPRLEDRLIAGVLADLKPVRPVASARWYATVFLAIVLLAAGAAIGVLGMRGWETNAAPQRIYFVLALTAGILGCGFTLPRLMIPGERLRIAPRALAALSLAALIGGCLSYPLLQYAHFGRAVATCFAIGMAVAAPLGALSAIVLSRGYVLALGEAALLGGLLGGLTAFVVLFVFCPHLDMGHSLLAHGSVVLVSALIGPAVIAARERLFGPE